jgi:proton-translocating NADH-quinone oxidoreductase chain N
MLAVLILFLTGILVMFSSFYEKRDISKWISLGGLLTALGSIFLKFQFSLKFGAFFVWAPLTIFMTFLILFSAFFLILNSNFNSNKSSSIYSLMLFSLCGAILMVGMTSLVTLFLGIEILSIPLYVLAASNKDNRFSLEAGLKYFILGSFSSAFLLFGIALIYGTFGEFTIDRIVEIQQTSGILMPPYFHIGVLFIFVALFFKMALAPFHFWSPDVYEGSPTIITGFMSIIVKIATTIALLYLMVGFFGYQSKVWMPYTMIVICISLIVSSILGLVQKNPKRLMAYSSISHASFLVLGLMIAVLGQNAAAVTFYLLAYSVASILVFVILNNFSEQEELSFDTLNGLYRHSKLSALGFTFALLSMAGIPLTGGFIAKWNVVSKLLLLPDYKISFIFALMASAVGIAYYLKMINRVFLFEPSPESEFKASSSLQITIIVCIVCLLALGLFPSEILLVIQGLF